MLKNRKKNGLSTKAIHSGQKPDKTTGTRAQEENAGDIYEKWGATYGENGSSERKANKSW